MLRKDVPLVFVFVCYYCYSFKQTNTLVHLIKIKEKNLRNVVQQPKSQNPPWNLIGYLLEGGVNLPFVGFYFWIWLCSWKSFLREIFPCYKCCKRSLTICNAVLSIFLMGQESPCGHLGEPWFCISNSSFGIILDIKLSLPIKTTLCLGVGPLVRVPANSTEDFHLMVVMKCSRFLAGKATGKRD